MICYFLRNIEKDPQGRSIGQWDGYQENHRLEFADKLEFPDSVNHAACEVMFIKFNRGSGQEVSFKGPSMSVGDLVVIKNSIHWYSFKCDRFGFVQITFEPRFINIIEKALE